MNNPKKPPLRIVVDTNLFISGLIIKKGYPHQLLSKWREQSLVLLTSSEQKDELIDVLTRPKIVKNYGLSKQEIMSVFFLLDTAAIRIEPKEKLPINIRDPKDEKILAIALEGSAEYLITGDEDLLVLNGDPNLDNLKILTAREFLDRLA